MRIRLLRRQSGITQEQFAERIGVSRSLVAQWETDRGGEANHLVEIARILDVPVEILLHGGVSQNFAETLSADEAQLLRFYRGCNLQERASILRTAERNYLTTNRKPARRRFAELS